MRTPITTSITGSFVFYPGELELKNIWYCEYCDTVNPNNIYVCQCCKATRKKQRG